MFRKTSGNCLSPEATYRAVWSVVPVEVMTVADQDGLQREHGVDAESHTYRLRHPSVATLPGGYRVGVVSADPDEVALAFLGSDPHWAGGRSLRRGETVVRSGLALTYLGARYCDRWGGYLAELRCVARDTEVVGAPTA